MWKGALLLHATFMKQMCSVLSGSKMPWLKSKVLRINYWNEKKRDADVDMFFHCFLRKCNPNKLQRAREEGGEREGERTVLSYLCNRSSSRTFQKCWPQAEGLPRSTTISNRGNLGQS